MAIGKRYYKSQPERHQLLTKYGIFANLYPTKGFLPAANLMCLENNIPDVLTAW